MSNLVSHFSRYFILALDNVKSLLSLKIVNYHTSCPHWSFMSNLFSSSAENLEEMACAIAIFDLSFGDHHSFALSEVLNIPLFTLKPISGDSPYEFAYSVLPSSDTFARAIVDIIEFSIGSDRTPAEQLAIVAEGKWR